MDRYMESIAYKLSILSGIQFQFTGSGVNGSYKFFDFHPLTPQAPNGFSIRINLGWKHFAISFIPDNFSRVLIEYMGKSKSEVNVFTTIAESIISDSGKINMEVNGEIVDPLSPQSWGSEWKSLSINLEKFDTNSSFSNFNEAEPLVLHWCVKFVNMVASLLPLEEITEDDELYVNGLPEGAKTKILVNKYERNPVNRAACISLFGNICNICKFDFEKVFGEIGRGYIHVHHLTPVSEIGLDYIVRPDKDLVPVCPNCHAMLHRRNPPFSPDELKNIIND